MSEREKANIYRQAVSEADIDWLFCVELNACHEFRLWAASRLFPDVPEFEHDRAWRSVSTSLGESDLIWRIELPEKEYAICFIENKIKAVAQPKQYNRYVQRGHIEVTEGRCRRFSVALVAPAKYKSDDSNAYPLRISYEEIVEWLHSRFDERSLYLADIYNTAIKKHGTPAPIDEDMTSFQCKIWQLASADFKNLGVKEPDSIRNPGKVSKTQDWLYIDQFGYKLIYKMYKPNGVYTNCVVDLELAGRGGDIETLKEQYENALSATDIALEKAGRSAVFRLHVPAITPPHFEREKVRAALQAASKLKTWWEKTNALPTADAD